MGGRGPSTASRALVGSSLAAIGIGPFLVDFAYEPIARQHLASVAWLGMWSALLLPGTAATDPEFELEPTERKLMGLHPQLFLSLIALGTLSGTVAVEAVRARLTGGGGRVLRRR